MTLQFFNNQGKPDTRKIEFERSVVQLGLEKAKIESEIEAKKRDLKNLNVSCDLVRVGFVREFEKLTDEKKKEVQEKSAALLNFDTKIVEDEKRIDSLLTEQKAVKDAIAGEEERLIVLSSLFSEAENKRRTVMVEIEKLREDRNLKLSQSEKAKKQFLQARDELDKINTELSAAGRNKINIESSAEKARKELEELNEIISVLQATNKQGLDVIASLEAERARLKGREEALDHKEADLLVYEKRPAKRAQDQRIDLKMIFE